MNVLPNGLGGSTGDQLVTCSPLQTTGNVRWVSSLVGNDSDSGLNREAPKATVASAVSVAAAGDIIVLMDGHAETVSSAIAVLEGMTIVGEGSSGGLPTVKMTPAGSTDHVFALSGKGAEVRNIWFPSPLAAMSVAVVHATGDRSRIIGCHFECGQYIGQAAVELGFGCAADEPYFEMRNTAFISTAASRTTQPTTGLLISDPISHAILDNVVFDDGVHGFSNDYALIAAAVKYFQGFNVSLLRGASAYFDPLATGRLNVSVRTGGGRVQW
jgi:hypothetical protein